MSSLWIVSFYGLLSGVVGTASGGLLACFLPDKNKRVISFILEYSAGLMMAIVCFDLLPNSFAFAPLSAVILGLLIGVILMIFSENCLKYSKKIAEEDVSIKNTGLAIALGISLHNLLEGLAVGSGFDADFKLGLSLAIAILLHDIPEGVSIAMPLHAGGTSRIKSFLITLASGIPMGLGALIGALVGKLSTLYIAMCLSIAGGAMLYIVFANMLPESKRMYSGRFGSLGSILGMISGIILSIQLS